LQLQWARSKIEPLAPVSSFREAEMVHGRRTLFKVEAAVAVTGVVVEICVKCPGGRPSISDLAH
jgi:hypothetical protein